MSGLKPQVVIAKLTSAVSAVNSLVKAVSKHVSDTVSTGLWLVRMSNCVTGHAISEPLSLCISWKVICCPTL